MLYKGICRVIIATYLLVLGYPVLLRFLRIFELDSAFFAAFVICTSFFLGSIFRFDSLITLPLVLGTIPLSVLARNPCRFVFSSLFVCGIQNRKSLRVSHVTGFAYPEWLPACAGMIGWQADEIVCCKIPQAETAAWALDFGSGTRRTGAIAAWSRRCPQVVPGM